MSKKTLIIVSFLVSIAVLVAVVLSMQKRDQKTQQDKTQESQDQNIFSQEESEEIERLKNDPSLVWYEVPEMGIRFRVTPDTKEDLGYVFKEYDSFSGSVKTRGVDMYSLSETDENFSNCLVDEAGGWSCGWVNMVTHSKVAIDKYLAENREFAYCDPGIVLDSNSDYICITKNRGGIETIISDVEYREIFNLKNLVREGEFKIYLNTIEKF